MTRGTNRQGPRPSLKLPNITNPFPPPTPNPSLDDPTFCGQDGTDCTAFINAIKKKARAEGKLRDNGWMVDLMSVSLIGDALRWYSTLDNGVKDDWQQLEQALLSKYPPQPVAPPTAQLIPGNAAIATPAAAPPPATPSTSTFPTGAGYVTIVADVTTAGGFISQKVDSNGHHCSVSNVGQALEVNPMPSNGMYQLKLLNSTTRHEWLAATWFQPLPKLGRNSSHLAYVVSTSPTGYKFATSSKWAEGLTRSEMWAVYPDSRIRPIWADTNGTVYQLDVAIRLRDKVIFVVSNYEAFVASSPEWAYCKAAGFNFRRYSTAPAPSAGKSNTTLYIGAATAIATVAAYTYLESGPAPAPKVPLTSALDKENFVDIRLKKIEPYNHNTAKLTFALPPNTAALMPIASCVSIKTAPATEDPTHPPLLDDKGKPYVRPYTPISPPDQPEEVVFLIKKYDTGKVTPYLHAMKPGQTVGIKGPWPKTPYKENQYGHIGMIAGGSGLTPMYQVLHHALALPNDKTKFTLIFSNVSEADILLRETLDAWAAKHKDRLKVVYALDKGSENWKGEVGYVTASMIKKHIPGPSENVQVLVCGPPGQVASVAGKKDGMKQGELDGALKELGYKPEQVFKF
ncbi:NADH-cytochrome b5 reductase [Tulasnella sp. 403]|nr:NADH-cytochrome b5 reductase [Tulasnella sp. 403]